MLSRNSFRSQRWLLCTIAIILVVSIIGSGAEARKPTSGWLSTFNPSNYGGPDQYALTLTEYNGMLVVGGEFTEIGGDLSSITEANNIAAFTGDEWIPFGTGMTGGDMSRVFASTVYNGDLIVGGNFSMAGSTPVNNIARWDGESWHPLGEGVEELDDLDISNVYALLVWNGDLYAAGVFDVAGTVAADNVARWDGNTWSAVGNGRPRAIYDLCEYDGDLVAGGLFNPADNDLYGSVAFWNGSSWGEVGPEADVYALTTYEYEGVERLIAGGFFLTDSNIYNLVYYDHGLLWIEFEGGVQLTNPATPTDHVIIRDLQTYEDNLVISGHFDQVGINTQACGIASWNGEWDDMGGGIVCRGYGHSVLIDENEKCLYLGGSFYYVGESNNRTKNLGQYVYGTPVTDSPEISLDPATIVSDAEKWVLNQLPFEIENTGVGTLDYEIVIPAEYPSITCLPTSGSIQAGGSETITLLVGVDNFPCGANSAYIEVASNDVSDPLVTLPLELTVTGDAKMAVEPTSINYGPVYVGDFEQSYVYITNRGCEPLPIMSMVLDNPDFSIPTITEVPAEMTIPLPLTFTPSSYGEIYGTLTINTFGDEGPESTAIHLSGEGVTPPEMVIAPMELSTPTLYTGATYQDAMTIYNNGGCPLDAIIGWGGVPPWVTLSEDIASIEPGGSLVIDVIFSALGYCEDQDHLLIIKSNDPDNVEVEFPLSMTVLPESHIATSVSELDWGEHQYIRRPITMSFDVYNLGCAGYTLTVSDLESSLPSIFEVVTATPFTVDPGESYEVEVKVLRYIPPGIHYGTLTISSDDPDNPEVEIELIVNITGPSSPLIGDESEREIVTASDEHESLDLRAYPNPFNPSTEVMFNLDRTGNVELRIYDVRGALVKAIDNGYCSGGPVSIPWNGSNSSGASVASGIYFYRVLLSGSQLGDTKKMILLR